MNRASPTGGRRAKQLRSAVRTIRKRRPTTHSRDGNPELIALVEEPYSGVEETHRRLEALHSAFETRDDRRAVFLSIYARMTGTVATRVRQEEFEDPEWVGEYLVAFANLYREAVHDYETGSLDSLADPWQLAFEAAERGDSLVLQDALLGVNAHINYDLSLAVNDAGVRPDPGTKYADHSQVTDVIADIVDDAQEDLYGQGADRLETVDESLGRLDEWLSVLTIDECRDSAWRTAIALNSRLAARRRLARWINDVTSTGMAYLILSTQVSDFVHDTLRQLEGTGDGGG
jgi:hypothetical protein